MRNFIKRSMLIAAGGAYILTVALPLLFSANAAGTTSVRSAIKAMPTPAKRPRPAGAKQPLRQPFVPIDKFDGVKIQKSDAEWRKQLTAEEFRILRESGTEQPYSGKLTKNHAKGTYYCAACGLAVFSSRAKFESGTGWPSFFEPFAKANVTEKVDNSLAEPRTAIECARCGSHLGHVFDDGPEPTGLRYCINSVALKFVALK